MTYNSKWLEKAHEKMKSTGVYFDAKKIFFFLFSFVFNTVDVVGRDAGLGGEDQGVEEGGWDRYLFYFSCVYNGGKKRGQLLAVKPH